HVRDAEVERLFRRMPLIVGHAGELPPGHVRAHDEYGVPMLLARDADGRFRAFLNVCRHRGMRLVDAGAQALPKASIVCPYHGWTYRLPNGVPPPPPAHHLSTPHARAENQVAPR